MIFVLLYSFRINFPVGKEKKTEGRGRRATIISYYCYRILFYIVRAIIKISLRNRYVSKKNNLGNVSKEERDELINCTTGNKVHTSYFVINRIIIS